MSNKIENIQLQNVKENETYPFRFYLLNDNREVVIDGDKPLIIAGCSCTNVTYDVDKKIISGTIKIPTIGKHLKREQITKYNQNKTIKIVLKDRTTGDYLIETLYIFYRYAG